MSSAAVNRGTSLYLHVPFCASSCDFCAFYQEQPKRADLERYLAGVERELALDPPGRVETVFWGGGTPGLLPAEDLARLGRAVTDAAGRPEEWTVELAPSSVRADELAALKEAGVTRVSLGVQSFDAATLEALGRRHSPKQVEEAWALIESAGFASRNLDLMFAIPGQDMALWEATLDEALGLGTEHLSCYEVIYEDDTPLFEQLKAGEIDVDEELACAQYERLVERAQAAGFRQYEVANFARDARPGALPPRPLPEIPALACRHNVAYWRGLDFFGLGPSASEYVDGVRSRNRASTVLYTEQALRGHRAKEFAEALPPLARAGELAAFGLRMNAGWPFQAFHELTGFDLRDGWAADIASLADQGWAEVLPDRLRLTPQGLRFADEAARRMLRS